MLPCILETARSFMQAPLRQGSKYRIMTIRDASWCRILSEIIEENQGFGKLHKACRKMWIVQIYIQYLSTPENSGKPCKIKLCTKLSTLSTMNNMWNT